MTLNPVQREAVPNMPNRMGEAGMRHLGLALCIGATRSADCPNRCWGIDSFHTPAAKSALDALEENRTHQNLVGFVRTMAARCGVKTCSFRCWHQG